MILWLDAARGLHELYPAPAHRVVLIGDSASASIVRAQLYFDCVVEVDRARFSIQGGQVHPIGDVAASDDAYSKLALHALT